MKFLLIAIVVFVIVGWLSSGKKSMGSRAMRQGERPPGHADAKSVEQIVRCAHCGLHFPASEAVTGPDGTPYCSQAHRRQDIRGA